MMTALDKAMELLDQAALLRSAGSLTEAEACLRRAMAVLDTDRCPDRVMCANVKSSLASILEDQGRFHEAAEYAREAIKGAGWIPEVYGSRPPRLTVIDTLRLASGLGRELCATC